MVSYLSTHENRNFNIKQPKSVDWRKQYEVIVDIVGMLEF